MGMYSNFVFAEPADLVIDLSNLQNAKDWGIQFDGPCTLTDFGKYISGWKIYGYLNERGKLYKSILDEIHKQHPTVDFKIHFWYEENIMFYFCWRNRAIVMYGNMNDCNYFVKKEILNDYSKLNIFGMHVKFVDRFENNHKINSNYIENMKILSKEEKDDDSHQLLLHVPSYLRCIDGYFMEIGLK